MGQGSSAAGGGDARVSKSPAAGRPTRPLPSPSSTHDQHNVSGDGSGFGASVSKGHDSSSMATNPLVPSQGRMTGSTHNPSSGDEGSSCTGQATTKAARPPHHHVSPPQHAAKDHSKVAPTAAANATTAHPLSAVAMASMFTDPPTTNAATSRASTQPAGGPATRHAKKKNNLPSPTRQPSLSGESAPIDKDAGEGTLPADRGTVRPAQRRRSSTGHHGGGNNASRNLLGSAGTPSADCSESMLSDITVSEMSATFAQEGSARSSLSLGPGSGGYTVHTAGGGTAMTAGFLFRGDDLEQQRQQAPLSIEEDLFIYDDIVISKDEARTKHWRLAGRKPAAMALAAVGVEGAGAPAAAAGAKRHSGGNILVNNTGKRFFAFNDFDVCVDEMDLAPSSTNAANAVAAYQRELTNSSNNLFSEKSFTSDAASESIAMTGSSIDGANSSGTSGGSVHLPSANGSATEPPANATTTAATGTGAAASATTSTKNAATGGDRANANHVSSGLVDLSLSSRAQQRRILNASMSMTVTNTVAAVPNTVKVYEEKRKAQAPTADRELKHFTAESVLGHATRVKCIALAPGEREFASCSNEDASVALNNLGVRDEVGIFTGHQDTVINVAFSPDGKYLATTSKDKTMILWDVMTTKQLLTFSHAKVVICCCFGPDSKYLVSGCQDRICRLWDTRRGKEWLTYTQHEAIIISVAFSPCGGFVCSASADKTLRVWSSTTAKTRFTLTGHTGIILSCSYTTDGKYIVSNDENLLRVWSTTDGSCTLSLTAADVAGSTHLSPKGPKLGWTLSCAAPGAFTRYICVACNNRFVYVLDRETGKEVSSTFCKAPVYCLTSGTEELTACGDSFGNIYLLRMQ